MSLLLLLQFVWILSAYAFRCSQTQQYRHLRVSTCAESHAQSQYAASFQQRYIQNPKVLETSATTSGTRINKCLPGLSRRAADAHIASHQVTVNHVAATSGSRVRSGDVVRVNGIVQPWGDIETAKQTLPAVLHDERDFVYLKYWKPRGVTCTSDESDRHNIISTGHFNLFPQRLFTVGRLDKDSTGLILLTSDGRVNNAMLQKASNKEKVYEVEVDRVLTDDQLKALSAGILLPPPNKLSVGATGGAKDPAGPPSHQRVRHKSSNSRQQGSEKTLPCRIKRLPSNTHIKRRQRHGGGDSSSISSLSSVKKCGTICRLEITLVQGKNRQIRRMMEAVGCNVLTLHRTSFAGIRLKGLAEGNWLELSEEEMKVIQHSVQEESAGRVSTTAEIDTTD